MDKNYVNDYDFPCSHCEHGNGCSAENPGDKDCLYGVCSRDELAKRIYIQMNTGAGGQEELTEMWDVFHKVLGGYRYDVHRIGFHQTICYNCEGTGVVIDEKQKEGSKIQTCKQCEGTGLFKRPYNMEELSLWFAFKRVKGREDIDIHEISFLYVSEEQVRKEYHMNDDGIGKDGYELGEVIVNKHLLDLEDGTDTGLRARMSGIVDIKSRLHDLVMLKETSPGNFVITKVGDWYTIREASGTTDGWYISMERLTANRIMITRVDKMPQMMTVMLNPYMGHLRWNLFVTSAVMYINTRVTYKGADRLFSGYCGGEGLYPNWDDLFENIVNHTRTDNEGKLVDKEAKSLINQVQVDFRQYGIELLPVDALGVIEKIASVMTKETAIDYLKAGCDATVMFVLEYIIISKEYGEITDRLDEITRKKNGGK